MRRKSVSCFLLIFSLVFAMFAMPTKDVSAADAVIRISIDGATSTVHPGKIRMIYPDGTDELSGDYGFSRTAEPGNYTFEALPNTGYYFDRWTTMEGSHTDNPFSIEHGNYDDEYTAVFKKLSSYQVKVTVTCNILGAGTITYMNGSTTTTSGSIHGAANKSSQIKLTAKANPGYRFVKWIGSGTSTNSTYTAAVNYSDVSYTAVFEKIQKSVKVSSNNTAAGKVSLTGNGVNESGITLDVKCAPGNYTLTATANSGYKFKYWDFGDGTETKSSFTFEHNDICDYDLKAVFEKENPTQPPTQPPTTNPTAPEYDDPVIEPDTHLTELFVDRLYTLVLCRTYDEDGLNYWTQELYQYKRTGGQVAMDFFMSPEMIDRKLSNETYVEILYATFFTRSAADDPSGYNYWLGQLNSGMSRQEVVQRFIDSQEWADTCNTFGILSGGIVKSEIAIPPTEATYAFVSRMYDVALERPYDEEGLNYWALALSNYDMTGEYVGAFFFLSDEMNGYNLSDSEYLTRLYQTFMGRPPETDGFNYWMGRLAGGMSRYELVYSFTRSPEFVDKCIKARIVPYGDLVPAQEAVG